MHDLVRVDLGRQFTLHGGERLEGEIRVDRLGAIAGQDREVMDLAGVSGLDDKADRGALAVADQVMMHAGGGEQRRDRDAVRADLAIGQDDDVEAVLHRLAGGGAERV